MLKTQHTLIIGFRDWIPPSPECCDTRHGYAYDKVSPSARWTPYDDLDYNGMKEQLKTFVGSANRL